MWHQWRKNTFLLIEMSSIFFFRSINNASLTISSSLSPFKTKCHSYKPISDQSKMYSTFHREAGRQHLYHIEHSMSQEIAPSYKSFLTGMFSQPQQCWVCSQLFPWSPSPLQHSTWLSLFLMQSRELCPNNMCPAPTS